MFRILLFITPVFAFLTPFRPSKASTGYRSARYITKRSNQLVDTIDEMLQYSAAVYDPLYRQEVHCALCCPRSANKIVHREYNLLDLQSIIYADDLNGRLITVFRGSSSLMDWIQNIQISQVAIMRTSHLLTEPKVHKGAHYQLMFNNSFDNINEIITPYVTKEKYDLFFTGHSLGGQLATICGYIFAMIFRDINVTVVSFGSPRTGNKAFVKSADSLSNFVHYRVWNANDIVVGVPWVSYQHQGKQIEINNRQEFIFDDRKPNLYRKLRFFSIYDHTIGQYTKNFDIVRRKTESLRKI